MEWWIGWFVAGLLGLPTAIYYSLHLKSRCEESKDKQQHAKAEVKRALTDIINRIQEYKNLELQNKLREWVSNAFIPKRWRKELAELANLAEAYYMWYWELYQVIRCEFQLAAANERFKDKHIDEWLRTFGLWEVTEGRERSPGEAIYRAIYKRKLTFELARDAMLKDRWDSEAEGLKLKDFVEGDGFHKLVDRLQRLQEREVIKMLQDIQARLLKSAQVLAKEAT
ncbi:MAG: hypothetical protein ISS54_06120 [Dehalococcoidia bacterium]|nr:hypothetical protein [Dehalococcoidia bacterium]